MRKDERTEWYHYTESGLDNVFLAIGAGVQFLDLPSGKHLKIKDIEGLHKFIGMTLANEKKNLSGKEIRFLRQEMLLSQGTLAKLLGVTEQTVHRWETGKADIAKPAEALIRSLYLAQLEGAENVSVRDALERIANLENEIDGLAMKIEKMGNKSWHLHREAQAA
jgi:DNA-binding transcriptional regulator YiaG